MSEKIDVIIVGAGLSGLTAAYTLLERVPRLDVLILESSDRIGGRLLSEPLLSNNNVYRPYNIGGEFISSSNVFLLELLEKLKIKPMLYPKPNGLHIIETKSGKIYETNENNPFDTCSFIDRFQLFRFFLKLEELCEDVSFSSPNKHTDLDRVSLETFLSEWSISGKAKNIFRSLVLKTCGASTTQISTLFYLAFLHSTGGLEFLRNDDTLFIKGGCEAICHKIRKALFRNTLLLNQCVQEIEECSNRIVVKTTENVYHCSCIIIAVQPSHIKNIRYYPELLPVFEDIVEGRLVKFVVTYKTEFWKRNGFSGEVLNCGNGPILWCCDITTENSPTLSGLIYNSKEQRDFEKSVLKQLAKYFGEEALEPVTYHEKVWKGTASPMSCLGLNKMIDYSKILLLKNRTFLASAEVTDYYYGHMEGAVHSGFRAAIAALYELTPAAIEFHDMIRLKPHLKPDFRYKDTLQAAFLKRKVFFSTLLLFIYIILNFF